MAIEILKDGADISQMEIRYSPKFTKVFNADICSTLGIEVPDGFQALDK